MKTLADIKRRMTPGTRLEVAEQTKRPVLVGSRRVQVFCDCIAGQASAAGKVPGGA